MGLFQRKSSVAEQAKEVREEQEFHEKLASRTGFVKVDEEAQPLYNAHLMLAGAQLTQVCHPNGGNPDDIVDTYARVMTRLIDWFNIVPLREKLESMLDEEIWSRWSVEEQPVVPTYTPALKRKKCVMCYLGPNIAEAVGGYGAPGRPS